MLLNPVFTKAAKTAAELAWTHRETVASVGGDLLRRVRSGRNQAASVVDLPAGGVGTASLSGEIAEQLSLQPYKEGVGFEPDGSEASGENARADDRRDHDSLFALIPEYAGKLRQTCVLFQKQKTTRRMKSSGAAGVLALCLGALVWGIGMPSGGAGEPWGQWGVPLGFLLGVVAVSGSAALVFLLTPRPAAPVAELDITALVAAVEELVTWGEVLDQTPDITETGRLIAALRIQEGISALDYAAWTLGEGPRKPPNTRAGLRRDERPPLPL